MKYSQWIGIAAVLVIIAGCFLPWAYFPDLNKDFTGFFSEQNRYGRPGMVLICFGVLAILFFLIPRIWAKRANIFMAAVVLAWSFKSYLLYTACYRGICPSPRAGLFLVLGGSVIVMAATLTPKIPVKQDSAAGEQREQRPGAKAE
jgi:amino acid permease